MYECTFISVRPLKGTKTPQVLKCLEERGVFKMHACAIVNISANTETQDAAIQ